MTLETLKYINDSLTSIGINYEFMEWTGDIVYPYFVGEYSEPEPLTEDGKVESAFILTGFTRGKWIELESCKNQIEKLFNDNIAILDNNSGVAISYSGAFPVPTGDSELKKIQINLRIQEWKV